MLRIIKIELIKIFSKSRSYIGFVVSFIISLLVTFGIYLEGDTIIQIALDSISDSFHFSGDIVNGNLSTFLLYNSFVIHIPILVALVSGDLISGESNSGTIRLMLVRPISRFNIYVSKWIAGLLYTLILVLFFVSTSYLLGYILLGNGDLIVIRNGISVLDKADLFWRFFLAALHTSFSMMVISSLSICISSFTKNSVGPIVSSVAILIALNIICTIGFSFLEPILPYMFNVHLPKWQNFFELDINITKVIFSVFIQILYIVMFAAIGLLKFIKKDVLD